MAKFHGIVGYTHFEETVPGVFKEVVEEHSYRGDVLRNTKRWERGENLNDNLNINNLFSIIANDYAYQNIGNFRYIVYGGTRWKITNVEVQRPRIILTVGGVYNGQ